MKIVANNHLGIIKIVLLICISCDQEKFPKDKNIQGHWKQKFWDERNVELQFNPDQIVYFSKFNTVDTFYYTLNKSSERLMMFSGTG